ncbi:MAG: pilus assembly protein PilY [Ramlibacter sp.]|nr:pilus assembly protein PilY [Ramlibacter sp.]
MAEVAKRCLFVLGLWLSLCGSSPAAVTDIGNEPLFTSSTTTVKPNILFILDDSGSMAWDFLPDASNMASSKYGKVASQCNGVAYNPNITYSLPVNSTGTAASPGSLSFITFDPTTQTSSQRTLSPIAATPASAAGTITVTVTTGSRRSSWYSSPLTPSLGPPDVVTVFQNGDPSRYIVGTVASWNSSTGALVIDLSSGLVVGPGGVAMTTPIVGIGQPTGSTYYRYSGTQPRLAYTYTSAGVVTTTTFYRECSSDIGSSPGNGVFTAVNVTSLSAEAQNYANWYTYYRTRMTMMKSSISLAFKGVDSRYRVGYSTISSTNTLAATNFLNVSDFDATQKAAFYTNFNAASPISWTPLRGALSKAGLYYANKANGQTVDPVQYSCQRNFTILSTDGYWNTPDEDNSAPRYGPYKLDNATLVGQQDGSGTQRPMLDGNSVTTTSTETWTTSVGTITTVITPKTIVSTSTKSTTTITPVAGFSRFNSSLPVTTTLSSVVRPVSTSPFWITVTTSSPHYLTDTQSVQISSTSTVTGYTGTVVIDVIDSTHFRYTPTFASPARPNSPSGNYYIKACGVLRKTEMQDVVNSVTNTRVDTTTTYSTVTAVTTASQSTPYSRVIITIDGVQQSDTGDVPGTLVPTSSTVATTMTLSVPTFTTSTGANGTSTTSWTTNTNTWVYNPTTCGATLPSPNPSNSSPAATSTTATSTFAGPTPSGPTTTTGTSTTTVAPTSSASARVTASASVSVNGVSDSLADVAAYYYNTDLRDASLGNCTGALGTNICANNVKGATGDLMHSYGDSATWQHMTTFTLGLGVGGILKYDPNYQTQLSGDFFDIAHNARDWPTPGPTKSAENIDDLWHAAVNGRGTYFSAGDPASLASSLSGALNSIQAITGAASAASTSSLQPVEGDNDIYLAKFTTEKWVGDIESYKIDPSTGAISSTTTWKAAAQLDLIAESSRVIYYPNPSGASALRDFTYANLTTDSHNAKFDSFCTKTSASGTGNPGQCATLTASDLIAANLGANLVSYLRGNKTLNYYRTRDSALGDIINASPLFVGKPSFKYTENSYPAFAATTRTAVVLAAANDGMLHAFDRVTGAERWAYIPSFVLGNLYKLADSNYSTNHSYYVDGSPQLGDIYVGGAWKTIVVGGLNAGGKGYYALDVTNPAAPKLLWEFSATDLGLTFGNPIITKRSDGTWVVVFSSGYNNTTGDGNGHLYVVNANTGVQVAKIDTFTSGSTPAGTAAAPSGLGKINAWVDSELDNHALRFYGGDLLGNLWRFDIDGIVAPNNAALRLAELKLASGAVQSITVKPALGEVTYNSIKYPVVYVATGRYLGTTDVSSTVTQAVYAITDPLTTATFGDIRSTSVLVSQTISTGTVSRTVTVSPVDWSVKKGWRADFPVAGERVNINPQLILSTLYVGTNTPDSNICTAGGSSFLYKFDIATGGVASGESSIGTTIGSVLIQGITTVQLAGVGSSPGSIVTILTKSDGTLETRVEAAPSLGGALRRASWRELSD